MRDGSNRRELKRVNYLHRRIESDPAFIESHTEELLQLMLSDQNRVRETAVECFVAVSGEYPLDFQDEISHIIPRFDDESRVVRIHALAVGFNLVEWWPRDFASTTDLLNEIAMNEGPKERYLAVGLLSRIAVKRPDLVTARNDVLALLQGVDLGELESETGFSGLREETIQGAISSLQGGDMYSRPLNSDLAPVGRSTRWSKPARVGMISLVGAVFTVAFPLILAIAFFRFLFRSDYYTGTQRVMVVVQSLRKVVFFKSYRRGILYLRASLYPTPTSLLPFLYGERPVSEDPKVRTGDYPPRWEEIAATVYIRDGYQCSNCGIDAVGNEVELHADHKIPRSKGGSDHPNNLRTLCRGCHQARHARIFER